MHVAMLLAGALLAGSVTVACAETGQDVYFDEPQYIFACRDLNDLEYIIEGFALSPQTGRDRRTAKRIPAVPGGAPLCDYLSVSGKYALFSDLGGVVRLYLDESFGNGLMNDYVNVYQLTSISGVSLHVLLYFEGGGEQLQEGYDMLTRVLGVE